MKARLITVSSAALLCSIAGFAHAQQIQPATPMNPPSAQQPMAPTMEQQQTGDQSVGGAPMSGTHDSGRGWVGAPCVVGLSCDIYRGS